MKIPILHISGAKDNVVKLWNLDICDFMADMKGHEGPVTCVALADDEAFAVSGSEDKTVKVWSVMLGVVITDYVVGQPLLLNFLFPKDVL